MYILAIQTQAYCKNVAQWEMHTTGACGSLLCTSNLFFCWIYKVQLTLQARTHSTWMACTSCKYVLVEWDSNSSVSMVPASRLKTWDGERITQPWPGGVYAGNILQEGGRTANMAKGGCIGNNLPGHLSSLWCCGLSHNSSLFLQCYENLFDHFNVCRL